MLENYNSRLRRLEVLLPKPPRRYRNGADAAMAERLSARIPSDEEVLYFSQNHHYANEDFCAELDNMHSGVLEGCDTIFELEDDERNEWIELWHWWQHLYNNGYEGGKQWR